MTENTAKRLAEMTDEGVFERLATAILRRADSRFRSLVHPGVNAEGKTVKAPVDGITFVPGAHPPQMIAVHHTICAARDLTKKWLHDPATVKPRRRGARPTAPPGDIVKTIQIVAEERKRTPDLEATLILTTNQEPDETLVRDVHATGAAAALSIEIWSRSRLADFLDNEPQGQWLRSQFLGIDQLRLSEELLAEATQTNLRLHSPPDQPAAWVGRRLDAAIKEANDEPIVFVIAESGAGKTVACYKRLLANAAAGGFSLVLTDEAVASSPTLDQAIEKTLIQLCPALAPGCGSAALGLSRVNRRLLLAVEDINRSGRAAGLIERIARWNAEKGKGEEGSSWQLLCPVWPQIMSSLNEEARRRINSRVISGAVFSPDEGADAVKRRRSLDGQPMTRLKAEQLSEALGHDPLLIALHDPASAPDTSQTIARYVESCLLRLSSMRGDFLAAEYSKALAILGRTMLLSRNIEPLLLDMFEWPALASRTPALRHILQHGEIVRPTGILSAQKLAFRHDRVREWLLARAALELMRERALPDDVAAEPHFAEIYGLALAVHDVDDGDITRMAGHNALALFCALRHFRGPATPEQTAVVAALQTWLDQSSAHPMRDRYLRWEAMGTLAETENPNVRPLVARFDDKSWNALRARYRNGDLTAGITLCLQIEPGVTVAGHEAFLDHVKHRFGANLVNTLADLLRRAELDRPLRIGALRLAGHIGEPVLADAIRASWNADASRDQVLGEYLWASAQCIDANPATLLGPVCDAWAALPNTKDQWGTSPRNQLASDHIKWAFHQRLPDCAVRYFIGRAACVELKWPITTMLHGLDHPDAVEFVVRELAAISESLEGTKRVSPFAMFASGDWERRQDQSGRAMSEASSNRLLGIWQDQSASSHLRSQAFVFWAATRRTGDIAILRAVASTDELADKALWQLLRRGDREAIPGLIAKLSTDGARFWWQLGQYIWSPELTRKLDEALGHRGRKLAEATEPPAARLDSDAVLSEMLMRLPTADADALLTKHWDHLYVSHYYVIAALYVATPALQKRVADSMKSAPEPAKVLEHLSMRMGYRLSGHPGIVRPEQIEAVVPYLDLLNEMEIYHLWSACNERGWFTLRRAHFDSRLPPKWREWVFLDASRALEALDKLFRGHDHWIDRWLEDFLATGTTLDEIMAVVSRWLESQIDVEALQMAASAVIHIGERRHVDLLKAAKIVPTDSAAEIITNADFAVRRRTLRV